MLNAAKTAYLTVRRRGEPAQRGQTAPEQTKEEHPNVVSAVAFFKDNRRVVTGSWDCTLWIWDVQQGALPVGEPFIGHKDIVRSVAVSPDDRRIASGGVDKTVIIWDVESKQKVFNPLVKHTRTVWSVCFSPDGKRLASGSDDSTVVVWNAETGAILSTLPHRDEVCSVAFSPNGLKLATGSWRTVQIWRTDNPELLLEINAHAQWVRSVVWSPEGQQLLSASLDKTVKFWDSYNGAPIGDPCTGHSIYSLAISSDGSFIATSSHDKTVRLWSTNTHKQLGPTLDHTVGVRCVAISPNGKLLVSGDETGKIWPRSIKDIIEQNKAETDEEVQRRQRFSKQRRDTKLLSRDYSKLTGGYDDSTSSHASETRASSSHSSFDILTINTTARHACISGDLHTAEDLLTQDISADKNNHESYANRSVVRARNSEWGNALEDAVKSVSIQPSLSGYISKGIALCGNKQLSDAMEAFDLASIFLERNPITIDLLLLIKAVALFNANCHKEAMRRVQGITTAYQHSDTLPCSVVNRYLRVELAIIAFEDGRYSVAADLLHDIIPSIAELFTRGAFSELRLKIFTVLFGWDLDSFWQTVNQRRCDAFLRADRVIEAVESIQYMMGMIDDAAKDSCLEWSSAFKKDCTERCVSKGDEAVTYVMAIDLYSAGIKLDSSCDSLFAQRSKAMLGQNLYVEAIQDAEMVIKLNPSSYLGYELNYAALHGEKLYDDAIEAFKTMLSKLENDPDAQIRELRQQYVSPSEVEDSIHNAIHAHLDNAPLRLLNTSTGRLCDRLIQINTFKASTEYKELLSSSVKNPHVQLEPIIQAVTKYFRWVMLSHRWEPVELRLHDIQDKVVYDLDPVGTVVKLQSFCKLALDAGYSWAWSDTCCIDQNNNVEVQRSVHSMFVWYRQSALTIIYLSDVPPSAKPGALASSNWNTRGWTVQEFLAPKVVLFYQKDWTLYLDNHSPNHKKSVAIMQELEDSTGIDARALVEFRPGMTGAREKLQWSSSRVTTLQEDVAYSLFGIFNLHLPVIYGETKQYALGRLLQEIVAQSGDITALDWVGKSSEFNSCLPADITAYKLLTCTLPSLSEDQMQTAASSLQNPAVVDLALKLYTRLSDLRIPYCGNRRLQLPCIAFPVTGLRRRNASQDQESSFTYRETSFTYDVKTVGLEDLVITTENKLRLGLRTFLLIRPWNRHDLGLPVIADDEKSVDDWSQPESPSDELLGSDPGEDESVDLESQWRALKLIVRLGQPFGAFLLAQQQGGEYKRVASDHNIIARVKDRASVSNMMDVRTLEIL